MLSSLIEKIKVMLKELKMKIKNRKGFTLIEIGIVLMVIGIIIAAIMKGKDIIKSAQSKDFAQTFASKWVMIADSYYDKIGQNLGDGSKNGETAVNLAKTAGTYVYADGYVANLPLFDDTTNATNQQNIADALSNAGINVASLVKSNLYTGAGTIYADNYNPFEVSIAGEFTDQINVGVGLASFFIAADTAAGLPMLRNLVLFQNVPGDVAQAFDKIVDGVADGQRGKVLAFVAGDATADTGIPANEVVGDVLGAGDITSGASVAYTDIEGGATFTIGVVLDH